MAPEEIEENPVGSGGSKRKGVKGVGGEGEGRNRGVRRRTTKSRARIRRG